LVNGLAGSGVSAFKDDMLRKHAEIISVDTADLTIFFI
jgi:hypothetical protein